MDFNVAFQNLLNYSNEWAMSMCVINGMFMPLDEVEGMGWKEFRRRSIINMPLKLYKFFPNKVKHVNEEDINYSLLALKNNTVYLSSPMDFDDVYDSDININYVDYEHFRLIEYCKRCGVTISAADTTQDIGDALVTKLYNVYHDTGDYRNAIVTKPVTELKRLSNENFILKIKLETSRGNDIGKALSYAIQYDYDNYCRSLKDAFRIACFSTNPFSQLMWGGMYADCHRGFCMEYTITPGEEKYEDVLYNLYPMVYCKRRPEMTERITKVQDEEPTDESVWDIYFHGVLRKSIDWVFQNEWRLLLPKGIGKETGYNIPFFPITKVFLGNRMSAEKRREIIGICNEKGIPYVGVMKNQDMFEMAECGLKCENCSNMKIRIY